LWCALYTCKNVGIEASLSHNCLWMRRDLSVLCQLAAVGGLPADSPIIDWRGRRHHRRCWCLITPPLLLFLLKLPYPGLIANSWCTLWTVVHASVSFGETWKCSMYYTCENVSLYKQYFENQMWDKRKREQTFNSNIRLSFNTKVVKW